MPLSMSQKHIVIIGGGFAGLYTALRLLDFPWEKATEPQITLIGRHDRFVFSPLLYELITEEMQPWEVAPRYSTLLEYSDIRYRQGQVIGVDPVAQQVHCAEGEPLT